jgi:hypothetical protein
MIEYIEFGKQKQRPYMGKDKPPADEVRITFELLHKKNLTEYEDEGVKKVRAHTISVRLTKKMNERAKFRKLFSALQYGRADKKHIAQMLGEPFLINVFHNTSKKEGQPDRVYANIFNADGVCGISAPKVKKDPLDETSWVKLNVPPNIRPLKLFLFSNPTKDTWDSLYIEGTQKRKNEQGVEIETSKNWLQETIMSAVDFNGSSLQALIGGLGEAELPMAENELEMSDSIDDEVPFDTDPAPVAAPKPVAAAKTATPKPVMTASANPTTAAAKPVTATPKAAVNKPAVSDADAALAALGL